MTTAIENHAISITALHAANSAVELLIHSQTANPLPFSEILSRLTKILDNTSYFSEVLIFTVDGPLVDIVIQPNLPNNFSFLQAVSLHHSMYSNNIIERKVFTFDLNTKKTLVAYITELTTPKFMIYTTLKLNINPSYPESLLLMSSSIISHLLNLSTN